jgi:hypothetical protein
VQATKREGNIMFDLDPKIQAELERLSRARLISTAATIVGDLGLVLDWVRVARSIVAGRPSVVIAGILEDWSATAGVIYKDGQAMTPDLLEEIGVSRAHTSSQVGTPGIAMIYPGEIGVDSAARVFACSKRAKSKDDWDIFWDKTSLAILRQA